MKNNSYKIITIILFLSSKLIYGWHNNNADTTSQYYFLLQQLNELMPDEARINHIFELNRISETSDLENVSSLIQSWYQILRTRQRLSRLPQSLPSCIAKQCHPSISRTVNKFFEGCISGVRLGTLADGFMMLIHHICLPQLLSPSLLAVPPLVITYGMVAKCGCLFGTAYCAHQLYEECLDICPRYAPPSFKSLLLQYRINPDTLSQQTENILYLMYAFLILEKDPADEAQIFDI
ncbi:MAG: hypothetical protein KC505_01135 [Myxococcales bacterium]|nr:hypothetical protein [Myxococcales bacterium]USN50840.1 MAG: hypothetical protein H6731_11415 [Myxococcales bacterium]